ncbi:uncharacterized protein LOC117105010 [Anneissia japonica]|uniref:uncharacterized protein LOC117105010 n=1 Tax=Anneissia japonica TaxID=1529436 RepID=UPI001425848A|nr:uncharacterized protein LOC117105010 [Anneissia japonica]
MLATDELLCDELSVNGRCYYYEDSRTLTWFTAREKCQEVGFDLVSINSQGEEDNLLNEFQYNQTWLLGRAVYNGSDWQINGNHLYKDTDVDFDGYDVPMLCLRAKQDSLKYQVCSQYYSTDLLCERPIIFTDDNCYDSRDCPSGYICFGWHCEQHENVTEITCSFNLATSDLLTTSVMESTGYFTTVPQMITSNSTMFTNWTNATTLHYTQAPTIAATITSRRMDDDKKALQSDCYINGNPENLFSDIDRRVVDDGISNRAVHVGSDGNFSTVTYYNMPCAFLPRKCVNGLTVSLWIKPTFTELHDDSISYITSSGAPSRTGFAIYRQNKDIHMTVNTEEQMWETVISHTTPGLMSDVWSSIAFTWAPNTLADVTSVEPVTLPLNTTEPPTTPIGTTQQATQPPSGGIVLSAFLDGELINQSSISKSISVRESVRMLVIGGYYDADSQEFNYSMSGLFDEFAIADENDRTGDDLLREVALDACKTMNDCDNGTCFTSYGKRECRCKPGFEGDTCDLDIKECDSSPCLNGTCVEEVNQFTCDCIENWAGVLCDKNLCPPVNYEDVKDLTFYNTVCNKNNTEFINPVYAAAQHYPRLSELFLYDSEEVVESTELSRGGTCTSHPVLKSPEAFFKPPDITEACIDSPFSCDNGFAVSLWVRIDRSNLTNTSEPIFGTVLYSKKGQEGLVIRFNKNKKLVVKVFGDGSTSNRKTVTDQFKFVEGIWFNIGVSWRKDTETSIYINGNLQTTNVSYLTSNNNNDGESELTIGSSTLTSIFLMTVSDIVVWNRYLFEFESYRFVGVTASEWLYLSTSKYYIPTDKFIWRDHAAIFNMTSGTSKLLTMHVSSIVDLLPTSGRDVKGSALELMGSTELETIFSGTFNVFPLFSLMWSSGIKMSFEDDMLVCTVSGNDIIEARTDTSGLNSGEWANFAMTWSELKSLDVYINGILADSSKEIINNTLPPYDAIGSQTGVLNIFNLAFWERFTYSRNSAKFLGVTKSQFTCVTEATYCWLFESALSLVHPYTVSTNGTRYVMDRTEEGRAIATDGVTGWVSLGNFDTCPGDPSQCNSGFALSLWLKFVDTNKIGHVLSVGGKNTTKGVWIQQCPGSYFAEVANGTHVWTVNIPAENTTYNEWFRFGLTWAAENGLSISINGKAISAQETFSAFGRSKEFNGEMVLGKVSGLNESYVKAEYDDIELYLSHDVKDLPDVESLSGTDENVKYDTADEYYVIETEEASNETQLDYVLHYTTDQEHNQYSYIDMGDYDNLCLSTLEQCSSAGVTMSVWFLPATDKFTNSETNSEGRGYIISSGAQNNTSTGFAVWYNGTAITAIAKKKNFQWEAATSFPFVEKTWSNVGFSWSEQYGIALFIDGQLMSKYICLISYNIECHNNLDYLTIVSQTLEEQNEPEWIALQKLQPGSSSLIQDLDHYTMKMSTHIRGDEGHNYMLLTSPEIVVEIRSFPIESFETDGYVYPFFNEDSSNSSTDTNSSEFWQTNTNSFKLPRNFFTFTRQGQVASIVFTLYQSLENVFPNVTSDEFYKTEEQKSVLNSKIMSITVNPPLRMNLYHPFTLVMEHLRSPQEINNQTTFVPVCAFWNYDLRIPGVNNSDGAWDKDGCDVKESNENYTTCDCYHLTSFAIFMEPKRTISNDDEVRITWILRICSAVSIIPLTVLIAYYLCTSRLKTVFYNINLNLCLAVVFNSIGLIVSGILHDNKTACGYVGVYLHTTFLSVINWLLVGAIHIYFAFQDSDGNEKNGSRQVNCFSEKFSLYLVSGWGIPMMISATTFAVTRDTGYAKQARGLCWLSNQDSIPLAFTIPLGVASLIILLVVFAVTRNMTDDLRRIDFSTSYRSGTKGAFFLTIYCCVTWAFGNIGLYGDDKIWADYIFSVLISFLGVAIFCIQGFLNKEVNAILCWLDPDIELTEIQKIDIKPDPAERVQPKYVYHP